MDWWKEKFICSHAFILGWWQRLRSHFRLLAVISCMSLTADGLPPHLFSRRRTWSIIYIRVKVHSLIRWARVSVYRILFLSRIHLQTSLFHSFFVDFAIMQSTLENQDYGLQKLWTSKSNWIRCFSRTGFRSRTGNFTRTKGSWSTLTYR